MTLLQKYEKALEVAQSNEKLQCVVIQIQQTIEKLRCNGYKPTSSEEVWVDYFLEKNYVGISFEQAIDRIKYRIETASHIAGKGDDGKAFEDLELAIQALEKQVKLKEWIERQKQKDPWTEALRQDVIKMVEQFKIRV